MTEEQTKLNWLKNWAEDNTTLFRKMGFVVERRHKNEVGGIGLPFVLMDDYTTVDDRYRFLKRELIGGGKKTLLKDGALLTPPGM